MTLIRRLAYLALVLAYAQIVFGAIVRITDSGMGCGDHWPKCNGLWFPPLDNTELVIEISSPSTRKRDETIKRRLYERAGVSEYWVVDPEIDVIRVYRREHDQFGRPAELSREAGDVLTTALLPGLEMPLARIFKE